MKTSRRAALLASLLACLGPALAAPAGAPHLLLDVNVNPGPPDGYSLHTGYMPPTQFATVQGHAVFFVDNYFEGSGYGPTPGPQVALWASDGTPEGTEVLAAFCTDGFDGCHRGARLLGQARGVEFLAIPEVGYDNYFRWELWRTDGTREGTWRLPVELCISGSEESPQPVTAGGVLYFSGTDGPRACVPWRSDGTAAGTERLESLETGGADESWPASFVALGDRAFFGTGAGLWTVDASSRGIRLVHALPGTGLITVAGDRLFFLAAAEGGEALWVSDGEIGGEARPLQAFRLTPCEDCDPLISFLRPVDGGVVFLVNDPRRGSRLWRSDGTAQGTHPVAGLPNPVRFGASDPDISEAFIDLGSRLLFPAGRKEGLSQLWAASPPLVSAAPLAGCPEGCPVGIFRLQPLPGGRRVVFAASAPRSGQALWVSDGTAAGTRPLIGSGQSVCASPTTRSFALGDSLYFGAEDAGGPALCRTDGTREGTVLLARVALPFQPGGTLLGGQALLGVSNGARFSELWATDGSPAGTRRVRTFARAAASSDPDLISFGEGALFTAHPDATTLGWWWSDGTSTRKLADLCPESCFYPAQQVTAGGLAFVLAGGYEEVGTLAPHLIRTDGTAAGTREVLALDFHWFAKTPFAFAGRFFFFVCDTDDVEPGTDLRKCGLWSSDGTPEGTGPRVHLPASYLMSPPVVIGGSFYLGLFERGGLSIYQSDGTQAGTRRIASPGLRSAPQEIVAAGGNVFVAIDGALGRLDAAAPGGLSFLPGGLVSGLAELDGRLLFFGSDGGDPGQAGLWSTDGTLEGTRFLAPVLTAALTPYPFLGPPEFTRVGSRLVFRGWDPGHGFEPWATDGTAGGTALLRDVAPGKASSLPSSLVRVGDQVWLTAADGDHGRELWVTDGTPEGTRLAVELAPGPFSLEPAELTLGGKSLFFSADSLFNGREPWVLPLQ